MAQMRTHRRIRRGVQVAFLAGFVLLFFILNDAGPREDQLAYEMGHAHTPTFLLCLIDPLASLSAFVASRQAVLMIWLPLFILALGLVVPRLFCGFLCPLGTLIDVAGALRFRLKNRPLPRLKAIKYDVLAAAVGFSLFAVPLAGFVTPLPILTRAANALVNAARGWQPVDWLWPGALLGILLLSLVHRRFWCNYLCPTGALLSLAGRFSLLKRRKSDACISCRQCLHKCPFDAVRPDDFEVTAECTWCGACGPVCKPEAISFGRGALRAPVDLKRRDFLTAACVAGGLIATGGLLESSKGGPRLRPPGSLNETDFLARCVRCGLCARNCPGPAISLVGIEAGLMAYGTPEIVPARAGCSSTCNNCGRVCPTGAIVHLGLDDKNDVCIGTARHIKNICLPHVGQENCGYCHDICHKAGHDAINYTERLVYLADSFENYQQDVQTVLKIPHVLPDKCVGCGLCVQECMRVNVKKEKKLSVPAIAVDPKSPAQSRVRHHRRRGGRR